MHCSTNPFPLIGRMKCTLSLFHALWHKAGSACSTRPCWCASPSLAPGTIRSFPWQEQATDKTSTTLLFGIADGDCQKWMLALAGSNSFLWQLCCSAAGSPRCLKLFPGDPRSRAQRLLHEQLLVWLYLPAAQQELPGGHTVPCRYPKQNHDVCSTGVTTVYLKQFHYKI